MKKRVIFVAAAEKSQQHLIEYLLLGKEKIEIHTFNNCTELIHHLSDGPDMVILGRANDTDQLCIKAAQTIKRHFTNLPVIILSAIENETLLPSLGIDEYIPQKEYFIDTFVDAVDRLCA